MALKVDTYKKKGTQPTTAAVLLYTHGGERHNNRQLLELVANTAGILMVGAQTPGTGRLYINKKTRDRLHPGAPFEGLAAEYAGEMNEYLNKLGIESRLLIAQSGRVALGALMQTSEHAPFTHVLLRDGIMLHPPETLQEGIERLSAQPPARHTDGMLEGVEPGLNHRLLDVRARWHGRVEAVAQRHLFTSTIALDAVRKLAGDALTPVTHITFDEGIAGPIDEQWAFAHELVAIRGQALGKDAFGAPLKAGVVWGSHADLGNPVLLHTHMQTALGRGGMTGVLPL